MTRSFKYFLLLCLVLLVFASQAQAFGAGNIASISAVEGKNWRHGDIEDILKQVQCIRKHKWNSMMMKRVYFGNWLRDYSQAMDTGALKKAQPETIRVLVWLLSFLGFGYATAEFEVTRERLGVYRPEEHIDNPKDYNDNEDARKFDERLRAPVRDVELAVDPETAMKNYIANGRGDWATSAAFVKYSFEKSIHHGRQYCAGRGIFKGNDDELAEACRLLGQGLHTLEDFGAHTNYVELALIEMGHRNVFPHVGQRTMMNVRGKHIYPLTTGTFGMVDFYHSVLGEATDHFTQSEINEMDNAMGMAETAAQSNNPLMTLVKLLSKVPGTRELCDEAERLQASSRQIAEENRSRGIGGSTRDMGGSTRGFDDNYSPSRAGPGDWNQGYQQPSYNQGYNQGYQQPPPQQQQSWGDPAYDQFIQSQQHGNQYQQPPQQQGWQQPPQQQWGGQQQHSQPQQSWQRPQELPGSTNWNQPPPPNTHVQPTPSQPQEKPVQTADDGKVDANIDPAKIVQQIYPILAFRDKVVRAISSVIEKIPGLEALVERIVETLTVFILSLLAPIIRPIINIMSKSLETGSEGVISSNGKHQFDVWNDPSSSDPTHSMLSKDHFSNLLNEPAGAVAAEILKFIAPRILYAWEHPDVPVKQVMADVDVIFHHPALRDERGVECHRTMYKAVADWVRSRPDQGRGLDSILSSESVKAGKNHKAGVNDHKLVDHHTMSQQQMHSAAAGSHAGGGGGGGLLGGITGMLGGGSGGQQHGGGQQHSSSPFGMVGDLVGKVSGQGGGHSSSGHGGFGGFGGGGGHSGGGQQGGGLGDMLHMAEKLPGVGGYASKLNKFTGGGGGGGGGLSSFLGGGKRGLDDEPGSSRALDAGPEYGQPGQQGHLSGGYQGPGAEQPFQGQGSGQHSRSPSPMPLPPPPGYESYTGSGLEYDGQEAAPGAYAGGYGAHGGYQQSGGGGHGGGYEQQGQQYRAQQYGGQQYGSQPGGGGYGQGYDQQQQGGYGGGQDGYYR